MIICRSRGFIFLRVPKTASSSLSAHICDHIQFDHTIDAYSGFYDNTPNSIYNAFNIKNEIDAKNQHATLDNYLRSGLLKSRDLSNCKVYGVLREPIERTISLFSHMLKNYIYLDITNMSHNEILERGLEQFHASPKKYFFSRYINDPNNKKMYPLLPQSNWLIHYGTPISNIIVYPQFSKFLFDVTSDVNLKYYHNKLSTRKLDKNVGGDIIQELKKIYSQDFVLWEKHGIK